MSNNNDVSDVDVEAKPVDLKEMGDVKLSLFNKGVLILQSALGEYYLAQIIYCLEVMRFTLPVLKRNGEIIVTYADDLLQLNNDQTVLATLSSVLEYAYANGNKSPLLVWKKKT